MVNTKIRLIIIFAAKDGEVLYGQQNQDQELTGSDHELFIVKFRLKLKKVGKNTRPFSYASCTVSHSVVSDSCDPIEGSLPGSSVHGILQARILKWVAISFSRGSSQPRDGTQVSCVGRLYY